MARGIMSGEAVEGQGYMKIGIRSLRWKKEGRERRLSGGAEVVFPAAKASSRYWCD